MDKKRLQIIITCVLVVILVLAWSNSFKVLGKKFSRPKPVPGPVNLINLGTKLDSPAVKSAAIVPVPVEEGPEWGRCPFSGKTYAETSPQGVPDLKLSGIIWDAQKPVAMINEHIVKKGDSIFGITIVEIKQDRVIVNNGDRDIELRIGK